MRVDFVNYLHVTLSKVPSHFHNVSNNSAKRMSTWKFLQAKEYKDTSSKKTKALGHVLTATVVITGTACLITAPSRLRLSADKIWNDDRQR